MAHQINTITKSKYEDFILKKIGKNQDHKKLLSDNYTLDDTIPLVEQVYILKVDIDDTTKIKITKLFQHIGFLPFVSMDEVANYVRSQNKKNLILYAHNGTGKTRLSMAFKESGKERNEEGEVTKRDTLYFNAFTEDLFHWDNDLINDEERRLLINPASAFIKGARNLDIENKIRPLIQRYCDYNFLIDPDYKDKEDKNYWAVNFIREEEVDGTPQNIEYIKVSRGEENLFIWCFFLAIVQLIIDKHADYTWVKYIYIDDPISSLDENNAIALAHHLCQLIKTEGNEVKTIISTHHSLFFNVLCNELGKDKAFLISRKNKEYWLKSTNEAPFLYHVTLIQSLKIAIEKDELYTYHFNILRIILEKAANFHGFDGFHHCIKINDDDEEFTLRTRMINIFNHGSYSLFDPVVMGEENKEYFKEIFANFLQNYKFNEELFVEEITA